MSARSYDLPVAPPTSWETATNGTVVFDWRYDQGRDALLSLYEKGKRLQWDANTRVDWSHDPDPGNPFRTADAMHPLFGTALWDRLDAKAIEETRRHMAAWQLSQFLHGEQGALICASKIVANVPDLDSKFYAATQVMDEARHVEAFGRLLTEKVELTYPLNPHLGTLIGQILRDSRWDFTYLGMQILIEGLALASFGLIRDMASDPLARQVVAFVMQDEARHVAFGRIALREYYPQLSDAERLEREEFAIEACYLMRDRFLAEEVWTNLGFGPEALEAVATSVPMQEFRRMLFSRIVPALKDIGLWGKRIQAAFADMGVLAYANLDLDALNARDDEVAAQLDAERVAAGARVDEAVAIAAEDTTATDGART